jgi:antitoxin VapB
MAFHVRDEATDAIVRKLAGKKNKSLTETIRQACEREYEREYGEDDFMEAVREAQEAFAKLGEPTGLKADKAFYDWLSGDDELTGTR